MKVSEQRSVLSYIKKIGRPVFTTFELTQLSGKSQSMVVQELNYLQRQGVVFKIYRGIWGDVGGNMSAYTVIPFLFPPYTCVCFFYQCSTFVWNCRTGSADHYLSP